MEYDEFPQLIAAILLLFLVSAFVPILGGDIQTCVQLFIFSFFVICIPVLVRKGIAYSLDARAEHRIWHVHQYGIQPDQHFKKELPFGLLVPLFFSVITMGLIQVMTILTYETRALKHRAAKRFGFYSYSEMTDWHNGLIGAAGIVSLLLISLISYFPGWELLTKMAAYYAFWNMLPLWNLDGTQILFGNKIIWSVLAIITLIFTLYAMIL